MFFCWKILEYSTWSDPREHHLVKQSPAFIKAPGRFFTCDAWGRGEDLFSRSCATFHTEKVKFWKGGGWEFLDQHDLPTSMKHVWKEYSMAYGQHPRIHVFLMHGACESVAFPCTLSFDIICSCRYVSSSQLDCVERNSGKSSKVS